MLFRGGDEVAGFVVDAPIGRGGSSDVYRVHRTDSTEPIAWKVMRPKVLDKEAVRERFRREFGFAAIFDQPHIVRVHDRGTLTEPTALPWLSMQFVDGGSAERLIPERSRQPDVPVIISVIMQIAEALDVVHAAGVIHRDVKPANMLVDASSDAVLIDFGIAQYVGTDRESARTGMIRGSIPYAAPEVLTGAPLTIAVDEYALACSLFELLTGTAPYWRATATTTIRAHLRDPVPLITARRKWLPRSLDSVFAKALDKDPARRYVSCVEFTKIVAGTLRGVPVPDNR